MYLGALPSAFRLRDLLKQAFATFSHDLGMETQMRPCDTTNSVCPQGLSQVASLCADKIKKKKKKKEKKKEKGKDNKKEEKKKEEEERRRRIRRRRRIITTIRRIHT